MIPDFLDRLKYEHAQAFKISDPRERSDYLHHCLTLVIAEMEAREKTCEPSSAEVYLNGRRNRGILHRLAIRMST